jgi:hypothetical protein
MVFEAVEWLQNYLKPEMKVFEWGAGGSTLFLAKRVQSVITVEHDPAWKQQIFNHLKRNQFHNVDLELHEPDDSCGSQNRFFSTDSRYEGLSFQKYVEAIGKFSDDTFNLVVVDGRARPSCICHAISKICQGGYLLLDNSELEIYDQGKKAVSNWPYHEFCGPGPYIKSFWATTIWQKP